MFATYDGKPIRQGQEMEDFRGEKWVFIHLLSERKVYVRSETQKIPFREFFIGVFPKLKVEGIDG